MEQPPGPGRSLVPWPCSAGTAGAPMTTSAGTGGGELSKGKGAEKQEEEELGGSSSARSSSSTLISRSLASPMETPEQPRSPGVSPVPRPSSFGTAAGGAPMRTRQEATSSAGTGGAEKQEEELQTQSSTDRSSRSTMIALSFASPMEEEEQPRDLGLLPSPVFRPCSAGKADASSTTTVGWQGQGTSTGKGKQAEQEEVLSTTSKDRSSSTLISLSLTSPMQVKPAYIYNSPGLSPVPCGTCSAGETGASSMMTTRREATSASGRCVPCKVMEKQAEEEDEELRSSTSKDEYSLKMVPQQPPTLPTDLLLDIIERTDDVKTVVRCALGSKTMLRDILSFLEKRTKANGGFDPSLLTSVSYRVTTCNIDNEDRVVTRTHSIVVLPPGRLGMDTDLLCGSSEPASSRDGLLVLFQNKRIAPGHVVREGLLIVNTITGHVMTLPSTGHQQGTSTAGMFKPALLSVNGGVGRSFELLVMYRDGDDRRSQLVTQIFSSQENEWGAAHRVHIHNLPPLVERLKEAASTAPAMVGRRVHWLCYTQQYDGRHYSSYIDRDLIILALDTEELGHATVIEVPQELQESTRHFLNPAGSLILATTTATAQGEERQLSIVAAEALVISMWTLVSTTDGVHSWCRQVVIRRREVVRPHASVLDAYQQIRFSVFGERSGTVLFWMHGTGLVQLNLGTKKSVVLLRISAHNDKDTISQALLYEINLMSVLRGMESP